MSVNPSQLLTLLAAMIAARQPLLITGAPGIGKSDIVAQAAIAANARLLISHPAVSDPTDYKGLPWFQAGDTFASFKPFGDFYEALSAKTPLVWALEDLGQSTPAVQAACMQLLLARRVNGHILPDCVTFVALTNRRVDRAGVSGILEPVKSRFASIVELETDIDSWCNWAYTVPGFSPSLIAFMRYRSDLLCNFQPSADLTNSPLPRTWSHLNKLEALNLPADIEIEAFSGAVGNGPALEYQAFRAMFRSLVNIDSILLNPDKAAIPCKPSELYAVAVGLANRANPNNFARVATYITRLATEQDANGHVHGEFAVLCLKDAERRDPMISFCDARVRLASGPIGKLYTGQ